MSSPKDTEQQLRNRLDGDQPGRERMCLGILALDPRFTEVKPRHPKGGRDGSRDIEARYEGRHTVWGAVGFRNSVSDSPEDKKWVKKKFREDLDSAKSRKNDLWGFVFFTNIHLTAAEVTKLEQYAKRKGTSFVEVFYRERLRIELDKPRGLFLRYQYLRIELSHAEQASFFAEFGADLETLVLQGFKGVEEKLARLEFLHECAKPLKGASVVIKLRQSLTPEQLGHFRILMVLTQPRKDPTPQLLIGIRDSYSEHVIDGNTSLLFGTRCIVRSLNPNETLQDAVAVGISPNPSHPLADGLVYSCFPVGPGACDMIEGAVTLFNRGPFHTLGDLDEVYIDLYVTERLLGHFALMNLWIDDYVLTYAGIDNLVAKKGSPLENWPNALTQEEQDEKWIKLLIKGDDPSLPPPAWPTRQWRLDFSAYTPVKVT